MIQFVWIIIKDTPIAGMRFIKISDQEERERLERFYGWLSGPISEFTGKVQDIIIEGIKYYYHSNNEILFVVGADLDETSISSIFLPELEDCFFSLLDFSIAQSFDEKDFDKFRIIDKELVNLVKAFEQRKIEVKGNRKDLDAFEVLNLPSELQMVALVLVKMQVATPEIVSQITGLSTVEVEQQLRDIYQRGYLHLTTISDKSYYSVQPFESDDSSRIISRRISSSDESSSHSDFSLSLELPIDESLEQEPFEDDSLTASHDSEESEIDLGQAEIKFDEIKPDIPIISSAMMAPPVQENDSTDATSSFISSPITQTPISIDESLIKPLLDASEDDFDQEKKDTRGIKIKIDPIGREIDKAHRETIIIPKNGFLPTHSLRRERSFLSGKIRIPTDKNKDPFLINSLFKKEIENIFEALFMGNFLVLASENPMFFNKLEVDNIFETMNLLTPHRELKFIKSNSFVHPKDADIIAVPKELIKYYSWATVLDIDQYRVIGGNSSEFTKVLTRKLKKLTDPKDFIKEVTNSASILLKIGRDINTLKIEGRPPDLYLNEVKKTFGLSALDAGLTLSERLIRLHKDCAYIAGFYIRKGLDIAVRAILVNEPIVIMGDDPLDIYHIIEALSIFAPHKAITAQIWTTNYAEIDLESFDLIGAQEGTDRLFRNAVKVNLRSMSVFGGSRSEFLHSFLRQMWRRRSKDRPKFIRDKINEMINNTNRLIHMITNFGPTLPSKAEAKIIFNEFEPHFPEFAADFIHKTQPEYSSIIRDLL